MLYTLPRLPYAKDALAPNMSAETLDYHYGKHLQTYIDNLNRLVSGTRFETMPLEDVIIKSDGALFNNAAQVWNHARFFLQLSPTPALKPAGELAEAIDRDFGSFEAMKEAFTKSALGLFGSGWTWLSRDKEGKLSISNESNAGNPLTKGLVPVMVCDVWEHAYYIDHRNARAAFLEAFWKMLDWNTVDND